MNEITIMLVDDEESLLLDIRKYFEAYPLKTFSDPQEACLELKRNLYDILIVDYRMPAMSGLELLIEAKKAQAYEYGILLTAYADKDILRDAVNRNLVQLILEKPIRLKRLKALIDEAIGICRGRREDQRQLESLKRENEELKQTLQTLKYPIIGADRGLQGVLQKVNSVAPHSINVLVTGETGTGKEVVAHLIHELSPRKHKRFVTVNCSAIPEELLESELFGYVKGAFTGASRDKPGKIELAHEGTLFLDEIGEMKVDLQAKLLRVLDEKELDRLGSNKPVKVDFRLIAATNRDLEERVKEKCFREDLYYRINTFPIHIPPLRERKEDIPDLVRYALEKGIEQLGGKLPVMSETALQKLCDYRWPGNVRELENAVMRALLLSMGKDTIIEEVFDFLFIAVPDFSQACEHALNIIRDAVIEQRFSFGDVESELLVKILAHYDGNVSEAVQQTGIPKDRFYRIRKH